MADKLVTFTVCIFSGTICLDRPLSQLDRFGINPFPDYNVSARAGVRGQTVVVPEGGTATISDLTISSTGGSSVLTGSGQQIINLDIFGTPSVSQAFANRVQLTQSNSDGFRNIRVSFTISNVQQSDAGVFQCTSQFDGSRPCGTNTLVVAGRPTKPQINILTNPVIVGKDVIVECRSTSTSAPANNPLKLAYNLKENGRLALRQPTTSSRFRIGSISKAKRGARYSCVATEQNTESGELTGLNSVDSDEYVMNPQWPPDSFELTPSRSQYTVSTNAPLPDITCSADCNPPCSFSWYKNQNLFITGPLLRLGTAEKTDAGSYVCRATNPQGSVDVPVTITVEDRLGNIELIPPRTEYTVPEGTQVEDIFCRAECTPACTYTWQKNGQTISDRQGVRLGRVGAGSSGTYTCVASNGEDSTTISFVVDVQYPPKDPEGRELISPANMLYQVEEGALVLPDIVCNADCNPQCTVQWTKDNSEPAASGDTLSLGTAGRDDTGKYTCTASNSLGQTTTSVEVRVEFRPENVALLPSNTQYTVVNGKDVMPDVTCSANCNPECRYEWLKNDDSNVIGTTAVLSLGTATRQSDGTYICRAVNKLGETRSSFTVAVLYGPETVSLVPPQSTFTVPSGTLLPAVTCSADCKPACSYRWVKDDSTDTLAPLATLSLGQADPEDAGIYKCLATNDHGEANAKFDLAVQFGPSSSITLQPPDTNYDLSSGDDLSITCSAVCDPACTFRWEDSSGITVPGGATLQLTDVTNSDAGTYSCVADNGVGTPARKPVTVNVFSPLTIKQGNSVVLTCSAECSPSCTYKWMKDSTPLDSSNGILTLNEVRRGMDGNYTCEASNIAGSDTKAVALEVQYGPGESITFNPNKTTHPVQENSDLTVICAADCKPQCTFKWLRGEVEVSTKPVLLLGNIQRNQADNYECIADNDVRQRSAKQITVDVLYGPDEVRMFPDEQQLYPVRGSSVSLKCWATCNPECTYTWYSRGSRELDSTDGELDLKNVTTSDTGEYTCVASNGIGPPASRDVDINVRAGPGTTIRFNPPEDTAVIVEGRRLKVECIAECSPACSYTWRKGSTLVAQGATLEFPVTDRDQAGSYICFASNNADSQASKPLTVEVQYGPEDSISLFPEGDTQTYLERSPFNIKCSADCNPSCNYTWFLGAQVTPSTDGVLFSPSATLDQAGSYSCQASNGIGSASSINVNIDIQTGPGSTLTFIPPGNRQVVTEGEDLLVTCSADCSPSCRYTWRHNTEDLQTQGGQLELASIDRDQKGLYTCVADNGFGNQGTKQLNVDVQYGPGDTIELFPADSKQVLNEGNSIFISCSADCNPACTYTWYLGNEAINSTNGGLSLVAVGPENAGTYRCAARNGIGLETTAEVALVVQTGPGNTVKIEPEGDMYNVTEGKELRLKCSAVCSPPCTYTWYYASNRVRADDGVLSVPDVSRDLEGPYVCYAVNSVGIQGSRLIQVDVMHGPVDGIVLDPANNVTVEADNAFFLRCSANCDPSCQYAWFRDGRPVPSEGGKLTVTRATEAEGGSYTCEASNGVGSMESEPVVVTVQYGPRDTITLDPAGPVLEIKEDDDVIVTCSAEYAGTEMAESKDGVLTITKFHRDNPRFYTCFADNGLGNRATVPLEIKTVLAKKRFCSPTRPHSRLLSAVLCPYSARQTAALSVPTPGPRDGDLPPTNVDPDILPLPSGLKPEQGGTYTCTAFNGISTPAQASVDIDVLPGQGASIRFFPAGLTASVTEDETLQIRCAANCIPDCDITWTREGQVVSPSSKGVLLLTDAQRDQAGVYQCNARNSLGVNVTQQLSVTVDYGPTGSTKLFPPEETTNLKRGDPLIVQCSALCHPSCTYTWKKGREELSTEEGVLLVPNVTPDDRGRYTCTASNGKGPDESVNLSVNVNFGPEDTVTFDPPGDSRSAKEGDDLMVQCAAQCLPACTYTWYYGGSRRLNSTNGKLSISGVTRQDAGSYTCYADNGVGRRMSQDFLLNVEFPPNTPTFDPASTSYTIRERIDSVSDIRCFADCNPRCDMQWLKDGRPLQTAGNVLELTTPDRSADGVYTCVATNVHGTRQKDLTIHVNYAPSITLFTINDQKTVATVREKYPVTINCRVASKPPSTVQIFNGSKLIRQIENTLQAKVAWKQADCLDTGTYSCTADNGVGALVSVTAELKVQCRPRLDPRIFKQPYVAAHLGKTAVIRVPVLADPTPSFLWYKIRDGVPSVILAGSNDTMGQSDKFFTVNGTTSTLTIENVQLTDFGDYVVSIANERGTNNYTFSLVPQSAPYVARNLTARPVGSDTAEVTWSPGFNGGDKQQFLLEYLKEGTNGWRTLQLDPGINDVTRSVSINVSDLNPSTPYTFRVRSRNMHGYSNYSNTARVLTDAAADSSVQLGEVNLTPVLLGVGLALGFLVGAGITAIVVVSRCRPKTRKNGENTIDDFRSDTTYDTLYLRDALWAQRHIKMRSNSTSNKSGGFDYLDGYDYKQPEDTVRGYNDYSAPFKSSGEARKGMEIHSHA
ncbi:hypothetical protein BaRGS_00013311 [Batillaria attramentaria]|uniref:Uncharacterized protein n=1 Tax=Batillaria attramentaria TaxID=370345 RepID=A0ABD0L874_9CAEN